MVNIFRTIETARPGTTIKLYPISNGRISLSIVAGNDRQTHLTKSQAVQLARELLVIATEDE